MPLPLPPNYQRVLSSLAEIIERDVLDLLRVLEGKDGNDEIVKITRTWTPDERKEKMQKLRGLLEANRIFFRDLGGKPVINTEGQVFDAKITHLWSLLNDSRPEKMKGYGSLTEEQKEWIDRYIRDLLKRIDELGRG